MSLLIPEFDQTNSGFGTLGRLDVLPVGDYGVRKGAEKLYGLAELPKRGELEALGDRWRPYRSVASWYLWRAVDVKPPE